MTGFGALLAGEGSDALGCDEAELGQWARARTRWNPFSEEELVERTTRSGIV